MNNIAQESLKRLEDYCLKENFKGYDPYDLQKSSLQVSKLPAIYQFLLTQINKKSPLNFRRLLNIKKNFYIKAMALFTEGYCNLYNLTLSDKYMERAGFFAEWLIKNKSDLSSNICWGYDYSYANRNSVVPKDFPTVIHHSYVMRALYKYWQIADDSLALDTINKMPDFILKEIPVKYYKNGLCFGYNPKSSDCCYNASLHAAESLALADSLNCESQYFDLIEAAVNYVVFRQKSDGVWFYSHGDKLDMEKKQIDFHQGFILESLNNINRLTQYRLNHIIAPAIKKGANFYWSRQFEKNGMGFFRYPKKYPADIHNQAQGVITFLKLSEPDNNYKEKAEKILLWTIENMQDQRGFFYYQKYKFFINKIPYIRWSQAWMFLALTEFLANETKSN